jgi:hypothetical protein
MLAATSNAREQLQVLFLFVQTVIYLPVSTWGNHNKVLPLGGVPAKPYHNSWTGLSRCTQENFLAIQSFLSQF